MDFAKLFQSVEDAVYEIMVWIILLPKTLLFTMFTPRRANEYIAKEWDKKVEERFDEYLSPVLLWLLGSVIPISVYLVTRQNEPAKNVDDFLKLFSTNVFVTAFYMMIIPFTYIIWLEILNKTPLRRSTLKISFYRHCYALAPAQILTVVALFYGIVNPLLFILGFLLIPIYEAFVFQTELKIPYRKAFYYTLYPQIILPLIGVILFAKSLFE